MCCKTLAAHCLLGCLLALAGCAATPDLSLIAKFQAAQEAFDQASSPDEFLRAAAIYQEILDGGVVSGPLLYNQGNAYMRAGQRGRAVACYRRASRHLPRDPYLNANLRYALGASARSGRPRPMLDHLLFWQDWLSYGAKFRLAGCAAALAFAGGVAALLWRRTALRRLAAAALAFTLLLALSAAYDWRRFEWIEHGVIIRDGVVARKGNAAGYEPAFDQPLAEAAEFRVVERRGEWLLIRLAGGQEGWIPRREAVVY